MRGNGKIAIVTGAARGIGAAIAERLAEDGAFIVAADIDGDGAERLAETLRGRGFGARGAAVDVSDTASLRRLAADTLREDGAIDILINNAGISRQVDVLDITEEEFQRVLDVNLKGVVFLSQAVLPSMMERRCGRIVNIASLAGERGGLFAGIHYSASKAGVITATKCLALKAGPYNVTVNAVAPGLIDTELARKLQFKTDEIAMKRLGTAREVADGTAFLASDRASYITGATLDINGGIFMR